MIKYDKSVHFRPFWSIFGTMKFFFKNPALSLFSIYQYLTSCQISKKFNEAILSKLQSKKMDGWSDERTDRHEIIGPLQSVGPKNIISTKQRIIAGYLVSATRDILETVQSGFDNQMESNLAA